MEFGIREKTDSCEIRINNKGLISAQVKVYEYRLDDAVVNALKSARELLVIIKEQNKGREK